MYMFLFLFYGEIRKNIILDTSFVLELSLHMYIVHFIRTVSIKYF